MAIVLPSGGTRQPARAHPPNAKPISSAALAHLPPDMARTEASWQLPHFDLCGLADVILAETHGRPDEFLLVRMAAIELAGRTLAAEAVRRG